MLFSHGINPNEIGDVLVVEADSRLHLFHVTQPSHDRFGHWVSDDSFRWQELPPALVTGPPDAFDGDQLWTMGIFRQDNLWYMLYTGNEQRGLYQQIGLATSPDLITWTRHPDNPLIAPDARWYEAQQTGDFRIDWRDPWIFRHHNAWHCLLTARQSAGPLNRRGCVAHATSTDGVDWEVLPPILTPRNAFDIECPCVFALNGRWYLIAIWGGLGRMAWRYSDQGPLGPWQRPANDDLLPGRNYAGRTSTWRGETLLWHSTKGDRDWGPGHYLAMAPPKRLTTDAHGDLMITSADWTPLHDGPAIEPDDNLVAATHTGPWHHVTEDTYSDLIQRATFHLDPAQPPVEFGLGWRLSDDGDQGVFAMLSPGRQVIELVKLVHNRPRGPHSLWRGRTVLQSYPLPLAADHRYTIQVIAWGPSIEVTVNGRLLLAHLTLPARTGQAGVIIEDGACTISDWSIQPITAPTTHWNNQ